jgi:hypothetical protein
VKKSLAALGATILGLGAATGGSVPAMADVAPLEPCESIGDQVSSVDLNEEWFLDCIPQYGLSKTEFTIVADENDPAVDFPSDFAPLTDFAVEDSPIQVSSTLDSAAMTAYFNSTPVAGVDLVPVLPMEQLDDSVGSQTYAALTIAPIASAGPATPETTPADVLAACELEDWSLENPLNVAGWVATYDPIDTTFTQTAGGAPWTYTVTAQSKPTYFFVAFDDGFTGACVTDGESTLFLDEDNEELYYLFVIVSPFLPEDLDGWIASPVPTSAEELFQQLTDNASFAAIGESGLYDLGTFARVVPKPQLAATGADASTLLVPALIGGGVLIVGGALVVITLVRRRRAPQAEPEAEKTTPAE